MNVLFKKENFPSKKSYITLNIANQAKIPRPAFVSIKKAKKCAKIFTLRSAGKLVKK